MSQSSGSGGRKGPTATQTVGLRRLGALRHQALMLAMQGRHAEAGRLLLDELRVGPEEVHGVDPEQRRLLGMAATYLQKAGEGATAAHLFELLGEEERAAQSRALSTAFHAPPASGRSERPRNADAESAQPPEPVTGERPAVAASPPAASTPSAPDASEPRPPAPVIDSARQLVVEGRHAEAGVQLATAGRHYDAGVCFIKAGDLKRALDELIQVPESTVEYRGAARTAIRLLTRLRHATLPLAQYVQTFVRVGPASEDEAQLVLRWSELLKDLNFQELSRAAFDSVAARYPDLPEVRGALQQLGMAAVSPTLWASSEEVAAASSRLGSAAAPVTKRSYELAQEMAPISHVEIEIEVPERPVPSLAGVQHNAPAPERPRSSTVRVSDIPPAASRHEPFVLGPGAVIGERFRLEAELGQGGMATVYAATDLELEEEVAIKVFSGQLVTKEWLADAVARFREELKVCRKLRHPNIIQVYDIGIHGGHRYITMELLRGRSLHALLGAPLDVEWSTACLIQACRGLYAAHERGVVHRDVKPENIFITDDGVVKIMDFGIAKSMHNRGQTAVGTLAGTPEYMAPEQITGFSTVGPAADQYALGIVAYQMLTGQLPFSHEEVMPLLMMHREQTPLPLRSIVPSLPEPAEAVVLRMLAKQPEQRFESCAAAAQAIGSAFGTA